MIIRREALQATLPATTAHDSRFFLQSVQIEPSGRVVSTNGHVLIIAEDDSPHADADFPQVAAAPFHGSPTKPVLLDASIAKRLIQTMPKKATIPILGAIQVSMNGSPDTVSVLATDLQTPTTATIDLREQHTFPQYERLIEQNKTPDNQDVKVCLAVDVLETLIKSAKAVNSKQITFTVPTAKPAVLDALAFSLHAADVKVSGLAMPCRV